MEWKSLAQQLRLLKWDRGGDGAMEYLDESGLSFVSMNPSPLPSPTGSSFDCAKFWKNGM